jgi:hypothetical protein
VYFTFARFVYRAYTAILPFLFTLSSSYHLAANFCNYFVQNLYPPGPFPFKDSLAGAMIKLWAG